MIEPVKDEWIIGKALFSIPLVGYLPLHIIEVTIIIVVIMVILRVVFVALVKIKKVIAAEEKQETK